MPNPSPFKARQAKRRRGKPGDLPALLKIVWAALVKADTALHETDEDETELIFKGVHAVATCALQYAKLIEVGELEARLAAIEEQMKEQPI